MSAERQSARPNKFLGSDRPVVHVLEIRLHLLAVAMRSGAELRTGQDSTADEHWVKVGPNENWEYATRNTHSQRTSGMRKIVSSPSRSRVRDEASAVLRPGGKQSTVQYGEMLMTSDATGKRKEKRREEKRKPNANCQRVRVRVESYAKDPCRDYTSLADTECIS